MALSRRTKARVCSCLFTITYLDGEPFIQRVHLRMLGYQKDIVIEDDSTCSDLTLDDCYRMLDEQEV